MKDLLLEAEGYVNHYFRTFVPARRCFHTIARTKAVVEAEELAAAHAGSM